MPNREIVYFIRFNDKRLIRLLLHHNYNISIELSSIYNVESNLYCLIKATDKLVITNNLVVLPQAEALSPLEHYVYSWALGEVNKTPEYVDYETRSSLKDNARSTIVNQVLVSRLFLPLTDIFAILNYTQDSFSDGGRYNTIDKALERIIGHLNNGAQIIDLGVESTRPNCQSISSAEEMVKLKEILPEVLKLKSVYKFALSVDSYHEDTIRWLLGMDLDIINDVSGRLPLKIVKEILASNRRYVAMHSLTVPASRELIIPLNEDVTTQVKGWMLAKIEQVSQLGYGTTGLILDPGIGFGKNEAQSWQLIQNIKMLYELPCELLLGHSRKSMFYQFGPKELARLDLATAAVACQALPNVDYLRLHDLSYFCQIAPLFG